MTTRTSKKQMNELEIALRYDYPNDMLYAAGEWDASGKAYLVHGGEWYEYKNNTEAYHATARLVLDGEESWNAHEDEDLY